MYSHCVIYMPCQRNRKTRDSCIMKTIFWIFLYWMDWFLFVSLPQWRLIIRIIILQSKIWICLALVRLFSPHLASSRWLNVGIHKIYSSIQNWKINWTLTLFCCWLCWLIVCLIVQNTDGIYIRSYRKHVPHKRACVTPVDLFLSLQNTNNKWCVFTLNTHEFFHLLYRL